MGGGDDETLPKPTVLPDTPAPAPRELIGHAILHFKIVERLGAGGMGVVYRAFDEKLRRDVALKVLGARYSADDRNKELIFREARSAAAVTDPAIAAIYDVHDVDGVAFIAMELVDGESLRARLARGALPKDEALRIAREIARGLAKAHAHGVVHRDLKPDNVMITRDGHVKLLDFGLAKTVEAEPVVAGAPADALGATVPASAETRGRVMGTPAYMSPEQARGEPVDARSDIFAFGVVMYEMLAGASPFAHRSSAPHEWSRETGDWTPRPPLRTGRRASDALVARCLELEPVARYRNGAALVEALAVRERGPRRWWFALPLAGVLTAAFALWPRASPVETPPCEDAAAGVVGAWNDRARAIYLADTRARAREDAGWFDRYATRLAGMLRDRCLERTSRRATSAFAADGDACLDRAVASLRNAIARPAIDRPLWPALDPLSECTAAGKLLQSKALGEATVTCMQLAPDGRRFGLSANHQPLEIHWLDGRVDQTSVECTCITRWLPDDSIACLTTGGMSVVSLSGSTSRFVADGMALAPDGRQAIVRIGHTLALQPDIDKPDRRDLLQLDDEESIGFPVFVTDDRVMVPGAPQALTETSQMRFVTTGGKVIPASPLSIVTSDRWPIITWSDAHTVLVDGRDRMDNHSPERLWRVTYDDTGRIPDPPEILFTAADDQRVDVRTTVGDRAIMGITATRRTLQRRGPTGSFPAPLGVSTADRIFEVHGGRLLVGHRARDTIDVVDVSTWRVHSFEGAPKDVISVAMRGDRVVGLARQKDQIVYFELDGGKADTAALVGSWSRLVCRHGQCRAISQLANTVTLATVSLAGIGERTTFTPPDPNARATLVDVSPDTREVAILVMTSRLQGSLYIAPLAGGPLRAVDISSCNGPSLLHYTARGALVMQCIEDIGAGSSLYRVDPLGRKAPVRIEHGEDYFNIYDELDDVTTVVGTIGAVINLNLLTIRR